MRVFILFACFVAAVGQEADVLASEGRRRRKSHPSPAPAPAPPRPAGPQVSTEVCGVTANLQGWAFSDDGGKLQLVSASGDQKLCLGEASSLGGAVMSHACEASNPGQHWFKVPIKIKNNQVQIHIKNNHSGRCLNFGQPVMSGVCGANSLWWEDTFPLSLPDGMIRTVGDPAGSQEQCLSVPVSAVPTWPAQPDTLCRTITESMKTAHVDTLPTVRIKGLMSVYLTNLDVYLGDSAKAYKFDTCGLMFDREPTENTGILRLTLTIPRVAFELHHFHYTSGPFHGSGTAPGYVSVHIEVPIHYEVAPPALHCEDVVVTVPYVSVKLTGGGIAHKILPKLTGVVKSQIKKQVPSVLKQKLCPALNEQFNKCLAVSKAWPDIVQCLSAKTPPPSSLSVAGAPAIVVV